MGNTIASTILPGHFTVTIQLLHSLDNHLRGTQFKSLVEMQNALDTFFASRPTKFYCDGIRGLPERWQKVVDADGDCF